METNTIDGAHRCPKCGQRGDALGGIVARETTNGTFSGSGSGVTFGSGGLGLAFGGVSGTTHQQSERAKTLDRPDNYTFNWWYVIGPLVAIAVAAVAVTNMPNVMQTFSDGVALPTSDDALNNARDQAGAMMSQLMTYGIPLVLVLLGITFVIRSFQARTRLQEETERASDEAEHDKTRQVVYDRLRYCESDNVVFDPTTGESSAATRSNLLDLVDKIAAGSPSR